MRNFLLTLTLLFAMTANSATTVTWETLGNAKDSSGKNCYVQRFTVKGLQGVDRICFNQFSRAMAPLQAGDSIGEIIPGYYYLKSPLFDTPADSAVIDIRTAGILANACYQPDGVHAVMKDGTVADVSFTRRSAIREKEQWSLPERDLMPYGDSIFRFNESLQKDASLGVYSVIPSFKKVDLLDEGAYTGKGRTVFQPVRNDNPEFYRLILKGDDAIIEYASDQAKIIAGNVLERLLSSGKELPAAVITDYPDLPYRGVLIDIVRNFLSEEDALSVARLLSRYRLNTIQLHITDDEAWRVEIPGLPELTEVGSRRGYTLDEHDFLAQIYGGNGDPDTKAGTANGYWSREEFIDFIQQCQKMGITVIPEIESPGHARAAIKSMEARFRRTGDDTYRLVDPEDASSYSSAQSFHDNVLNPALPATYRFMEKIIDEIEAMYLEARVPLKAIHIGGDEVPRGAWSGSPAALALMADKGIGDEKELHAYFVRQIAKVLSQKGIPMNGWQEVAVGHSSDYDAEIAPLMGAVNCWSTLAANAGVALQAANAGYPVLLCNVNKFYLDQAYNYHPDEPGLVWGGTVDEFNSLSGYVSELCPVDSLTKGKVVGIQGEVFSETLRSLPQLQYYLFPKMLGLAERAWNTTATYDNGEFNLLIGEVEFPWLASQGVNFRLRQPGAVIEEGMVRMNSPYEGAVIRYTLDGSEPTALSPVYDAPFPFQGKEIRARLYYLGKESVTTILFSDEGK